MEDNLSNKAHWSFWVITIFMLLWNLMGSINFLIQLNPEMISSYRENEQAIIKDRPLWATAGFAFSVFGGALGCILLLLKKNSALYFFIISLVGTTTAVAHSLSLNTSYGVGEIIGIVMMPIMVSVFLVWYAKFTLKKGWLKTHDN